MFPPGTDTKSVSHDFDHVLKRFGLSKAVDKDAERCVVVHLGFEFDSRNMQVRLPPNKRDRAINAINLLLSSPRTNAASLQSTLGFLSHCSQVVPLGRPFLRNIFSLLCKKETGNRNRLFRLTRAARQDLQWWLRFLTSWSSISMIQLSRNCFDVATDASGVKGIEGVCKCHVFSEHIPS